MNSIIKEKVEPVNKDDAVREKTITANEPTLGEKQAAISAKRYLEFSAFSRSGLIKQLEYEGFSKQEAEYGVSQSNADWNGWIYYFNSLRCLSCKHRK